MTILEMKTTDQPRVEERSAGGERVIAKSAVRDEARIMVFAPVEFEHFEPELIEGLPASLVQAYAAAVARHAVVDLVDGEWFAEVKGFEGVYGQGDDRADALADFEESLIGWVALKLRNGNAIPVLEGYDLNPVRAREQAS